MEICQRLRRFTGTKISEATICRFLQKAGFTGTKIIALQQIEVRRCRFLDKIQQYEVDVFFFD